MSAEAVRKSDREFVTSCLIAGPAPLVFDAWAKADIFRKWWVPEGAPMKLESCEMTVRTGGTYRLVFRIGEETAAFFGRYLEVVPDARLVWTNDEGGADAMTTTTVTFEAVSGGTRVRVAEMFPSKAALDEAIASQSIGALPRQLEQLARLIAGRA